MQKVLEPKVKDFFLEVCTFIENLKKYLYLVIVAYYTLAKANLE